MPSPAPALAEPTLKSALALGLEDPVAPETAALADFVARAFGPATLAIIHYGSWAQGAAQSSESARDLFVILEDYLAGYRSLAAHLQTRFSAASASRFNRILPPNVISIVQPGTELQAKCAVLSLGDLIRGCSDRARDQFVRGRLFQKVQLVRARDAASRAEVIEALIEARACTFAWGRPFLPARFDVRRYVHALLETSYAAEIRPEGHERIVTLIETQREVLFPAYGALLSQLVARGEIALEGDGFRDARPPGAFRRAWVRFFFARSKVRATLRWIKFVALYDDWLEYVVLKVGRRGGVRVELTRRERRWPLLFLWPRVVRYLLSRSRHRP